ncbi:MAG: hypothetical protein PVG66_10460 [Chromatiales bacterium]
MVFLLLVGIKAGLNMAISSARQPVKAVADKLEYSKQFKECLSVLSEEVVEQDMFLKEMRENELNASKWYVVISLLSVFLVLYVSAIVITKLQNKE